MRLRKGLHVIVYFDDHVEDGSELMPCSVIGTISELDRKRITLVCWEVYSDDPAVVENNRKTYSIVRKAITQIVKLSSM